MESNFTEHRKVQFAKTRFQKEFVLHFCLLVILGSVFFGALVYLMSRSTVSTAFQNSRLIIKTTADFILPSLLLSSLIVIVVTGIATVIITQFVSNRIAGPIYRLQKDIAKFAEGDLKVYFHIRKKDELQELAVSLNQMAKALRNDIMQFKHLVNQLSTEHLPEKAQEKCAELKKVLAKFEN